MKREILISECVMWEEKWSLSTVCPRIKHWCAEGMAKIIFFHLIKIQVDKYILTCMTLWFVCAQ